MQEVDREDLRELLASQSCSQDQSASPGIKTNKNKTGAKLLSEHFTSVSSNHLFCCSAVDQNTENVLLSAWSHPLLSNLSTPPPPTAPTEVQSDPLPDMVPPVQLDVELVKEEVVVVLTEDGLEEVEEAVMGRAISPVEQEAGDRCAVEVEVDR